MFDEKDILSEHQKAYVPRFIRCPECDELIGVMGVITPDGDGGFGLKLEYSKLDEPEKKKSMLFEDEAQRVIYARMIAEIPEKHLQEVAALVTKRVGQSPTLTVRFKCSLSAASCAFFGDGDCRYNAPCINQSSTSKAIK